MGEILSAGTPCARCGHPGNYHIHERGGTFCIASMCTCNRFASMPAPSVDAVSGECPAALYFLHRFLSWHTNGWADIELERDEQTATRFEGLGMYPLEELLDPYHLADEEEGNRA